MSTKDTTKIMRDGKIILLTIRVYQGHTILADGNDGKQYLKTRGGKWTVAYCTPV